MAGSLELLLNFLIPGVTLGLAADSTSAHSSNGPFFVCSLWQIHGLVLFELRPKAKHMGNAPPAPPPSYGLIWPTSSGHQDLKMTICSFHRTQIY